ncbi:hypothetical protein BCF11_3427 [Collimonas sp. PA-H2]|uniref:hypothetical protein n=1 Tax=Collimonas sp. PA-H2 TaxID=1881062 RepID=UPI000BF724A5|nr:hypothetical protein [Collimonas sp. PA-H2]PFH10989.1 hypothetical protein BCF11_3427 [Collimonas sp. PA-H2]
MPGLQIIITNAGRAALVNAEHNGTAPLKITEIGITAAVFTVGKETIALPGEIKRIKTISGEVVAPDTMHVTVRDDSSDTYTMRGIGYWLSNGVLLGVYSQPEPILQKSTQSMMLLAADVVFADIKATSLTFGDANFTNPPATVDRQGVTELATGDETVAGTDGTRAVTPAGLTPALAQTIAKHLAAVDPHQQYLTPGRGNALYFHKLPAVTDSDTDCNTLLDTGVRDVFVANDRGIIAATRLPMGADGYGTLTTENGGQFVHQVYTEASIKHRTWQRSGFLGAAQPFKGSDWKLLWDSVTFDPASKQDTLAYKPTQAVGDRLNSVIVADDRATSYAPKDRNQGVYFDFRNNDAGNLLEGGTQHGVITFRQWGAGDDFSGGPAHQLGFTANGNLFHRTGKSNAWEKYQRLLHAGQNGTLPDGPMPMATDLNMPPLGWSTYTQEATANRPSAYGQVFTSSLTGAATPSNGNWLMQRAMTTDNQTLTRVNIGAGADKWSAWVEAWTSRNFDPGSKATGPGFSLHWSGQDGQPTWMLGGNTPGEINVYNPSAFRVAYAGSAGGASNAENISNGNSYMRMSWSDPGGQTTYVWGSDGPTGARLCATSNLNVGNARTWSGFPLRFAENPPANQPYYVLGIEAGASVFSIYNRAAMAVSSSVTSVYAHQLTGQGLQHGGVGGYVLIKNKSTSGLPGAWEQRGQVYDYGSGAVEGNESSAVLWQRVA